MQQSSESILFLDIAEVIMSHCGTSQDVKNLARSTRMFHESSHGIVGKAMWYLHRHHEMALNVLLQQLLRRTLSHGSVCALVSALFRYADSVRFPKSRLANAKCLNVEHGASPLYMAAKAGSTPLVSLLLEAGADANAPRLGKNGETPLLVATVYAGFSGNTRIMRRLLDAGADPNSTSARGTGVAYYASQAAKAAPLRLLLRRGADVSHIDQWGRSVMHYASAAAIPELVRAGCCPNLADAESGASPLHMAAKCADECGHDRLLALLTCGALPTVVDSLGRTPLHVCYTAGRADALIAADLDVDVDAEDHDGNTPLHLAVSCGREDVMCTLLEHGASPLAVNDDGCIPLHMAARAGDQASCAAALMNAGHVMHQVCAQSYDEGFTPLHVAAQNNAIDVAQAIMHASHGYAAFRTDHAGALPLHHAASTEMAYLLLHGSSSCCDPSQHVSRRRDADGNTAIHAACTSGSVGALSVLLRFSCDQANMRNVRGHTPMHCAVLARSLPCIHLLLVHGVQPDVLDEDGRSPVDLVREHGNDAMRELFGLCA